MVVTDRRQKPGTIDFGCLDFGDVFQDEDNDICMKINNDYSSTNAVVLSTGASFRCNVDTPVTLLDVELIIIDNK